MPVLLLFVQCRFGRPLKYIALHFETLHLPQRYSVWALQDRARTDIAALNDGFASDRPLTGFASHAFLPWLVISPQILKSWSLPFPLMSHKLYGSGPLQLRQLKSMGAGRWPRQAYNHGHMVKCFKCPVCAAAYIERRFTCSSFAARVRPSPPFCGLRRRSALRYSAPSY